MFMGAFFTGWYYDGKPYTKDAAIQPRIAGHDWDPVAQVVKPVIMPFWFTRGSIHRALMYTEGPYTDPGGLFTVAADEALIFWEIKQGTPDWTPPPDKMLPVIYAILPINRRFVQPDTLLYKTVDPDAIYTPGQQVCVWFSTTSPPFIAGAWRTLDDPDSPTNRDNSGSLLW